MKPLSFESEAPESEDRQPDNIVQLRKDSSKTLELLRSLPANQQEVVRLKFQSGLSYREIASVTGMSVSNVGYLIHVAVKKLKDQMTESQTKKGGVQ
jgi:RNA polymerase sigma-70 factor (ECF subfamily)